MTKEVDFLSLSKTNNTSNSSGNSTANNVTKKEGLSLFDSLLLANTKDIKTVSNDSLK